MRVFTCMAVMAWPEHATDCPPALSKRVSACLDSNTCMRHVWVQEERARALQLREEGKIPPPAARAPAAAAAPPAGVAAAVERQKEAHERWRHLSAALQAMRAFRALKTPPPAPGRKSTRKSRAGSHVSFAQPPPISVGGESEDEEADEDHFGEASYGLRSAGSVASSIDSETSSVDTPVGAGRVLDRLGLGSPNEPSGACSARGRRQRAHWLMNRPLERGNISASCTELRLSRASVSDGSLSEASSLSTGTFSDGARRGSCGRASDTEDDEAFDLDDREWGGAERRDRRKRASLRRGSVKKARDRSEA